MTRITVTTKMVAEMRAARASGMLVREIAAMFGVGLVTVSKYTSKRAQSTIENHERARWQRLKADPAAYRKYLDKRRDCARRLTAERRATPEVKRDTETLMRLIHDLIPPMARTGDLSMQHKANAFDAVRRALYGPGPKEIEK